MEMETEQPEQIVIVQAQPADIDAVLDILEDAARWLVSRDIDQWRPGSFDRHAVAARIERGEVYLALEHHSSNRKSGWRRS